MSEELKMIDIGLKSRVKRLDSDKRDLLYKKLTGIVYGDGKTEPIVEALGLYPDALRARMTLRQDAELC